MTHYDLAIVGAGPGGYVAAIRAAQLGLKTVVIEKDNTLGGTCLNVGCIPSKALLQASEHYAWLQHDAKSFGIECKEAVFNFDEMMKRKKEIVGGLVQGIGALFKRHGVTSIHGKASVLAPGKIEVSSPDGKSQLIECKEILLATGSKPISLPFLPIDEERIVTSTGALSLKKIPKKLIVIGGGVIGVELASVYSRLGAQVLIVEMLERICVSMEETFSKSLLQILKKEGIEFSLGAQVKLAEIKKECVVLTVEENGKEIFHEADVVLVAVGRTPNIEGFDALKLKMQGRCIAVDNRFMTSIPHIYAIGDLIEGPMLAHRASEEGRVVAELLTGRRAEVNYMSIPNIVYTDPEVAAIGVTEKEARSKGLEVITGAVSFKGNPRARCAGVAEGMVKVIGLEGSHHLIGMHLLGPQASELIEIGMVAIEKKMRLEELAHAPFGHPTLSEAIKEACGQALGEAIHG